MSLNHRRALGWVGLGYLFCISVLLLGLLHEVEAVRQPRLKKGLPFMSKDERAPTSDTHEDLRQTYPSTGCFHAPSPQPQKLSACCWYDSSTCCDSSIAPTVIPWIVSNLTDLMGQLDPVCYYAIADLLCIVCSPDTDSFVSQSGTSYQINICESECNQLLAACQNDFIPLNIPSDVTTGVEFCDNLLSRDIADGRIAIARSHCFGGSDISVIETSSCFPAPSSTNGASNTTYYAVTGGGDGHKLIVTAVALSATVLALLVCIIVVTVAVVVGLLYIRWRRQGWAWERYGLEDPDEIPLDNLGGSGGIPKLHRSQTSMAVYERPTRQEEQTKHEREEEEEKEKEKEKEDEQQGSLTTDPVPSSRASLQKNFRHANTIATFKLNLPTTTAVKDRIGRALTIPQGLTVEEESTPLSPRRSEINSDEDV